MKLLSIDIECTTSNKGNPFDATNKLVSVAWTDGNTHNCVHPDSGGLRLLQQAINSAELLIGFNIKFDLHWLRRYGIDTLDKRVFDCQVAEYVISRQRTKYPSLTTCLEKYELPQKTDVVKTEYWEKSIDTDAVPWDILSEYNINDVKTTLLLYHKQLSILKPQQWRLIHLCCEDLLTLEEMEYNGIPVDLDEILEASNELSEEISKIASELGSRYPHIPVNFNSTDHLSAYLYGGTIEEERRVLAGLYKSGGKLGQPRYSIDRQTHHLDGLVKPIKGTELKKEGLWSTNEDTLRKLKDKTGVVPLLLKLAQLTKVNEFYQGFIKINEEMHWPKNKIHGQFNQVTTWTGRLSSTKPNLQNMPPEMQNFVRSEYGQAETSNDHLRGASASSSGVLGTHCHV